MKYLFNISAITFLICLAGNAMLFAQAIEHKDRSIEQPKKEGPKYAMKKVSLIDNAEFEVIDIMKEWDNLPDQKRNDFVEDVKALKEELITQERIKAENKDENIQINKIMKLCEIFLNSQTKENANNIREAGFELQKMKMSKWSKQQKKLYKSNLPGNKSRRNKIIHGNNNAYSKKQKIKETGLKNKKSNNKSGGNSNYKSGGNEDEVLANTDYFITDRTVVSAAGLDLAPSMAVDGSGNIYTAHVNTTDGAIRVYKSTDGGYTWVYKIGYVAESDWTHIRIDGNDNIYVTFDYWATPTNCNIYIIKSTDGGDNWDLYAVDITGDNTYSHTFTIDGSNNLYVVFNHWDGLWGVSETGYAKSTDGGLTWPSKDYDGVNNNQFSNDYSPYIDAGFNNYIYCVWNYNGNQIAIKNSTNGTSWSSKDIIETCDVSTNYHMPSVAASKTAYTAVVVWTDDFGGSGDEDAQRDYSTTSNTISSFGNNVGYISGSGSYDELFPRVCWSSDYWDGTTNYFYVVYFQRGVSESGAFYTKFAHATEALPGSWTNGLDVSDGQNTNGDYLGSLPAIASRKGTANTRKYPAIAWTDNRGAGTPNIYYSTYGRQYTITTNPGGFNVQVDGVTNPAPQNFDWPAGVSHTINAPSPQGGCTWSSWSDAGAQSHSITTDYGSTTTTITANFSCSMEGYFTSPEIALADVAGGATCGSWTEVGWNQTLGGGIVVMELCDAGGTPIGGWTRSYSGDGVKTWDISTLDPATYPSIRLRANLSGTATNAKVHEWYCRFTTQGSTTEYVWNGSAGTSWNDASNWCCGGAGSWPNSSAKNVTIKSTFGTANLPNVNDATAACGNLTVEGPRTMNVNNNLNVAGNIDIQSGATIEHLNGTITLAGDWRQDGNYNRNNSTTVINLTGAGKQIYGANQPYWGNLTLGGTSSYTINGPGLITMTAGGVGGVITFNAGSALNANGKPMQIWGNWTNNGGTFTPIGNTVTFYGIAAQSVKSNGQQFSSVEIDNTTTGTSDVTLVDDMSLNTTGTLTLTNGLLNTGALKVVINNTAGSAVAVGSGNTNYANSWINGNLRRYIANNTDVYDFPVGISTVSALAQLKNGNLTGGGFLYLDAKFNSPFTNTGSLDPANAEDFGTEYLSVATEGEWQLDANAAPASGNYDLYVYFLSNFSGLVDNSFGILKRLSSSTDAADWVGAGAG